MMEHDLPKIKIPFEWKLVSQRKNKSFMSMTIRAKVIGGWLVKDLTLYVERGESEHMIFISDPDHRWEIEQ